MEKRSGAFDLALARLLDLSLEDRLRAYRILSADLADKVTDTKNDRVITEREGAIAAIRTVAEHLSLPRDTAPTVAQFNAHAPVVAPGWNVSRATRAWAKWRFACDAAMGRELPFSASQIGRRKKPSGRILGYEDRLFALHLWLKSERVNETRQDYDLWAKEHNEQLPPGEPCLPGPTAIRRAFPGIGWPAIVRIAKGEITPAEAPARKRRQKPQFNHTGLDLLTRDQVLELRKKEGLPAYKGLARSATFPPPVIVKGAFRLWLRDDIVAHANGDAYPLRKENELGANFLDHHEAAKLVGLHPKGITTNGTVRLPNAVVQIGTLTLWSRAAAEAHFERWQSTHPARASD